MVTYTNLYPRVFELCLESKTIRKSTSKIGVIHEHIHRSVSAFNPVYGDQHRNENTTETSMKAYQSSKYEAKQRELRAIKSSVLQ